MGNVVVIGGRRKMKIYKFNEAVKEAMLTVPDVFTDMPDEFEGVGLNYEVQMVPIDAITEVAWTINSDRKAIEKIFQNKTIKLPLILVEYKGNGEYELHDGQHRYAAYRNVFPEQKYIKAAIFNTLQK
jgi:hypothetical protein